MYLPKAAAFPSPVTPAVGPPVLAPEGRTMLRVLDHRCHWRPAEREYSAIEGSSTRRRPVPWSTRGPRMAVKLAELGHAVDSWRDWVKPRDSGRASAIARAAV